MPAERDQAIVLRVVEYSETSQVVTVFARSHGLVKLIAKGSRRSTKQRFSPGLDLFELGDIQFVLPKGDAQLGTLTNWVQQDLFCGVRRSLAGLYAAFYFAELVPILTVEVDPHAGLFDALADGLRRLNAGEQVARVVVGFQHALLEAVGYAPQFDRCVNCRAPRVRATPAYFSANAGGLLCRDCEMHHVEKKRIPGSLADTTPLTGDSIAWFLLLDYHLTHVSGRMIESAGPLTRLLKRRIPPPPHPQ